MSGRVVELRGPVHRQAQELLPWYLTGRLDEDQQRTVDAHLRSCRLCQMDLEWQREMLGAYRVEDDHPADVDAGLARLLPRLERQRGLLDWFQLRAGALAGAVGGGLRQWQRTALVAQMGVIVILGWTVAVRDAPAPVEGYRGLSAENAPAAGAAPSLVVVFDPALSEGELRRIVRSAGARIVGGPTTSDGYLLAVDGADPAAALRSLRAQKGVRLVQSLRAGPPP
jgi:hypothetical protein